MQADTINLTCEECGNHSFSRRGEGLYECNLCGSLMGNDDAVRVEELAREARSEGYDAEVYPLVLVIRNLKGVSVDRASGGDPFMRLPPFVRFRIGDNRLTHIDNLSQSLELSSHVMNKRWVISAGLERHLYFELAPKVDPHSLRVEDVEALQADLATLAKAIDRDSFLSWWRA